MCIYFYSYSFVDFSPKRSLLKYDEAITLLIYGCCLVSSLNSIKCHDRFPGYRSRLPLPSAAADTTPITTIAVVLVLVLCFVNDDHSGTMKQRAGGRMGQANITEKNTEEREKLI